MMFENPSRKRRQTRIRPQKHRLATDNKQRWQRKSGRWKSIHQPLSVCKLLVFRRQSSSCRMTGILQLQELIDAFLISLPLGLIVCGLLCQGIAQAACLSGMVVLIILGQL